jgi:hypothetical protein
MIRLGRWACGTHARLIVVLCLCWGGAESASAQEAPQHATVSGRVVDASGGAVSGADVVARHLDTNVAATSVTDREGRFRFPYLRVGSYGLEVSMPGFASAKRTIVATLGSAFDVQIVLSVAAIEATVTITAEPPLVDTARSQIAGTIGRSEAAAMPLNGRHVLDLALLMPGVAPANVSGAQLFPETSAAPGPGLSVGSQRNLSNNFIVDGLSANDDAAGSSGTAYGVDAIDQLQVVTAGGQAELGRALGGVINLVTRSGTNRTGGSLFGYSRDDALNAPNVLSRQRLPMRQFQYGGTLGGPVARDRTFYFASAEQRRLDQSGLVVIDADHIAAINGRLSAVGYGGPLVSTGLYDSPVDTTMVMAKVDHVIAGRDHLSVRYSGYHVAADQARGAGGLNAASASSGVHNRDVGAAIGNVLQLSSQTVLESRAQLVWSDLIAAPLDPVGPAVSISGVATFGRLSSSPTGRDNRLVQIVNNVSNQVGAHGLRAGVDVLHNSLTIEFPRAVRGSYAFSSLASFLAGTYSPTGFTQTFGETSVSQRNPNVGVYVQDEWKPVAAVTVNVGLRYDLQMLETVATDRDNLAPRLGVAWAPFDSRRTVIRGTAGLFYDRVPLRAVANALLSAGNTTDLANLRQVGVSLSPAQTGAPIFPAILSTVVPSVTLVNLTTMDPALQTAFSRQAGAEIEQQIGTRDTLSVAYEHLRGRHLIAAINQNVPTCAASGANNGCRPIAAYANNTQYTAAGSSAYDAVSIAWIHRPGRWGHARMSYTWATAKNDVGEAFFSAPIDPRDISLDWGRSDNDLRHRVVAVGTVHLPQSQAGSIWKTLTHDWQVSGTIQHYSAPPFNILSGATTVQGTPARPMVDGRFIPRNAGRGAE